MKSAGRDEPAEFFFLRIYFAFHPICTTFAGNKQKLYDYEKKPCIYDAAVGCYVCSMFQG